ncbi:hypothetical protein [Rothia uropygialis]|uniref:hypothetical protein n=1 Tax=Kocuria sp. 36 TaxID=1415402 RepID=UPI0013E9E863|nr:hypothetical protein [Kocuria sp. 36]
MSTVMPCARCAVTASDRDRDFVDYVAEQVETRRSAEDAFYTGVDPGTGEVLG